MNAKFSKFLDKMSNYFASRKGLLPLLGIFFIVMNLMVRIIFPSIFLAETDLLLHFGAVISIFGLLLAKAL